MTYYVVAHEWPQNPAAAEDRVWTVSRDPKVTGWENDCNCDGYGLTHAEAQFLCDAANEKLAREIEVSP